jgi:hypothetical protein
LSQRLKRVSRRRVWLLVVRKLSAALSGSTCYAGSNDLPTRQKRSDRRTRLIERIQRAPATRRPGSPSASLTMRRWWSRARRAHHHHHRQPRRRRDSATRGRPRVTGHKALAVSLTISRRWERPLVPPCCRWPCRRTSVCRSSMTWSTRSSCWHGAPGRRSSAAISRERRDRSSSSPPRSAPCGLGALCDAAAGARATSCTSPALGAAWPASRC